MSNKPNIVFYSKNCNASKNLLMIMKNINILNNFILYCIEDKKVPNGIKIVPTLLVSSINKPLEGVNAFKWVENIKFGLLQFLCGPKIDSIHTTLEKMCKRQQRRGAREERAPFSLFVHLAKSWSRQKFNHFLGHQNLQ